MRGIEEAQVYRLYSSIGVEHGFGYSMLSEIVVGSRRSAAKFTSDKPYAMISFVGHDLKRSPPALIRSRNFRGRITIRANDVYPEPDTFSKAMTPRQADRIARFTQRIAPQVETLFIHCFHGHGRSVGAAIAIARAFNLPWEQFLSVEEERGGNGHITTLLVHAFESHGYDCGELDPGEYDAQYTSLRRQGLLSF